MAIAPKKTKTARKNTRPETAANAEADTQAAATTVPVAAAVPPASPVEVHIFADKPLSAEGQAAIAAMATAAAGRLRGAPARMRAVLVVKAKQSSRWRTGRHFGRTAVELNAADLSEAEIAAIEADPQLVTSREERPELQPT